MNGLTKMAVGAAAGIATGAGLYGLERLHLSKLPKIDGAINQTVPPVPFNRDGARMTWGEMALPVGIMVAPLALFFSFANTGGITGGAAAAAGAGLGLAALGAWNLTIPMHSPELISKDGTVPPKIADTIADGIPNPHKVPAIFGGAALGAVSGAALGLTLGIAAGWGGRVIDVVPEMLALSGALAMFGAVGGGLVGNGLAGPAELPSPTK